MNILKSFDLIPQLKKNLKTLMGKIVLNGFFYVCVNMENLLLNVIFLIPFVGIVEM